MDWNHTAKMQKKAGLYGALFRALAAKSLATVNMDVVIINKDQTWYDLASQMGGKDPVFARMRVLGLTSPEVARWIVENVECCPAARALRESLELGQASRSGALCLFWSDIQARLGLFSFLFLSRIDFLK